MKKRKNSFFCKCIFKNMKKRCVKKFFHVFSAPPMVYRSAVKCLLPGRRREASAAVFDMT